MFKVHVQDMDGWPIDWFDSGTRMGSGCVQYFTTCDFYHVWLSLIVDSKNRHVTFWVLSNLIALILCKYV